jgi:hypothetical protein
MSQVYFLFVIQHFIENALNLYYKFINTLDSNKILNLIKFILEYILLQNSDKLLTWKIKNFKQYGLSLNLIKIIIILITLVNKGLVQWFYLNVFE